MTSINEYFGHHPLVGMTVSIFHLAAGIVLGLATYPEIPVIVMQLFQIGAWSAGITAGVFTCYGVIKTHHGKGKGRKK